MVKQNKMWLLKLWGKEVSMLKVNGTWKGPPEKRKTVLVSFIN